MSNVLVNNLYHDFNVYFQPQDGMVLLLWAFPNLPTLLHQEEMDFVIDANDGAEAYAALTLRRVPRFILTFGFPMFPSTGSRSSDTHHTKSSL